MGDSPAHSAAAAASAPDMFRVGAAVFFALFRQSGAVNIPLYHIVKVADRQSVSVEIVCEPLYLVIACGYVGNGVNRNFAAAAYADGFYAEAVIVSAVIVMKMLFYHLVFNYQITYTSVVWVYLPNVIP